MRERRARTLMVQGTGSGVGKSLLSAALCRIYARRGVRVLPFKAQNMSNNAAVTVDGGEIGRAQALQARAAGVEPDVRMNPVLLKPLADTRSDVVVLGRSDPALAALPWHGRKARLWPVVADALDGLRAEADLVIIEGAGSPAETNLRRGDIVNMAVARHAGARVVLVADIDRGGAFAALYGTWALLEPGDRRTIRGFILNRFRGDASLLAPAPDDLERRTGVPTLGIVPYTCHRLPEEDAMGLTSAGAGSVTIAAVRLPHVANFDDVDPLAAEPDVRVRWIDRPVALDDAAAILIPGTRNTIADLRWLWESGLAAAIRARHRAGVPVIGLCGGYQMLGTRVTDPDGIEAGGACEGLGLLDVETELAAGKTTRRTRAVVSGAEDLFHALDGAAVEGYEIHHGRTRIGAGARAWLHADGEPIGARRCACARGPGFDAAPRSNAASGSEAAPDADAAQRSHAAPGSHAPPGPGVAPAPPPAPAWGAYLHGLFHDDALRAAFLASLRAASGGLAWEAHVNRELDRVADIVEQGLDLRTLDAIIRGDDACD